MADEWKPPSPKELAARGIGGALAAAVAVTALGPLVWVGAVALEAYIAYQVLKDDSKKS